MRVLIAVFALLASVAASAAAELRMVAFNIERGWMSNAELDTVFELMNQVGPAAIWALSEVSAGDDEYFLRRLGKAYGSVEGANGNRPDTDVLLILYDKRKFDLLEDGEIWVPGGTANRRPPLYAKLKSRKTGTEFYVVANHLTRGNGDDPRRLAEAKALNGWAKTLDAPAITLGDFNFDFEYDWDGGGAQHSQAYPALLENDVWAWVRPDTLQKTQCDEQYNSVLDFAFVAGDAKQWPRESRIWDVGCADDDERPDHLPIDLVITVP